MRFHEYLEVDPMSEPMRWRGEIAPRPAGERRPFWSVMIPTYNCAHYLRETLASVLAQDPGSEMMQIEVIDDHSTLDEPAAVVAELGRGRVGFYRQPDNVGHTRNFQTCVERARGDIVHLLHGDDCVRDGFYRKLQPPLMKHAELGAAFCRQIYMDERGHWEGISRLERSDSGVLDGWLTRIAVNQRIQTPSIVVRREVYEQLGLFDARLTWVEDWEMWVRIAAHYPVWYEVEPLALYRMHASSSTGRQMRTGENLRDIRRAIELMRGYLPPEVADDVGRHSRQFWAGHALRSWVPKILGEGELSVAWTQLRGALGLSLSPNVLWLAIPILVRMAKLWFERWRQGWPLRPPASGA